MSNRPQKNLNPNSLNNLGENTISITDIMLILARQLKIIIVVPVILCIVMIIYVLYFAEPVYTSTSKIMSSSSGGGVSLVINNCSG